MELENILKPSLNFWQPIRECYFCGKVIKNKNCEIQVPITEDGESVIKVFSHRDCAIENCNKDLLEDIL